MAVVRAIEVAGGIACSKWPILQKIPHLDTALFAVSSAEAMWGYCFHRDLMDASYRRFLLQQSQVGNQGVEGFRRACLGMPLELPAYSVARVARGEAAVRDPFCYDNPTFTATDDIIVGSKSLARFVTTYWTNAMKLALPFYIPLFSVATLVLNGAKVVSQPVKMATRLAKNVLQSSVFLASFTTTGFTSLYLFRSIGLTYANIGARAHIVGMLSGLAAGVTVLLEQKSRRIELAG
jgi:hypothetical protein